MKNIEEINNASVKNILAKRKIPEFFAGDIIKVGVRIVEGKRERIQYFEGVCIAKKNRDINSSFTVRKISFGEGVERTFALYSPIIGSIKVVRSGKVRRAKLYYLRGRRGKRARIAERTDGYAAKLSAAERQQAADLKLAANAAQAESLGLEDQIVTDPEAKDIEEENISSEAEVVTEEANAAEVADDQDTKAADKEDNGKSNSN